MRKFQAGNGSDSTANVLATITNTNELQLADLYLIGDPEDPQATLLTNWNSPLNWPMVGTFTPAKVTRGAIKSQFGLEVATLELIWSPPVGSFTNNVNTTSPYQLARTGFYDNRAVRLWRCVMPTPGDANTYGAAPWFGGRIAQTDVGRGSIKFTINSFLDVVNQMVPANVIENTNIRSGYIGATPLTGDTKVAQFNVYVGSTATVILADCTSPSAGHIYGTNVMARGYLVFLNVAGNTLGGYYSAIAANGTFHDGSGNHNQITLYTSMPWVPTPGVDKFYVSKAPPVDFSDVGYQGFPYIPAPESGV